MIFFPCRGITITPMNNVKHSKVKQYKYLPVKKIIYPKQLKYYAER